jgi:WD40 repeat protein
MDGTLKLWEVATRKPLDPPLMEKGGNLIGVAFSPDGKLLAAQSKESIHLWEIATRKSTGSFPIPKKSGYGYGPHLAFTLDGKYLIMQADQVILFDLAHRRFLNDQDLVPGIALSPDGKLLATRHEDDTIILWDMSNRHYLEPPLKGGKIAAFSRDGKTLALANDLSEITLWDTFTRQQLGPPLTSYNPLGIAQLVFSPDGKTLVSRNRDETVILWDLANHQPLDPPIKAWGDPVFSPDGAFMALGSDHGEISFWEVATRQPLCPPLTGHVRHIMTMSFGLDGKYLASGDDIGVILWNLDMVSLGEQARRRANRNLTKEEWKQYVGDSPAMPAQEPFRHKPN